MPAIPQFYGTVQNRLASAYLVHRIFSEEERRLPNLIYNTSNLPMHIEFTNREHPLTQRVIETVSEVMVSYTTYVTTCKMHLHFTQLYQLDVHDPRVVALKRGILSQIQRQPLVRVLRAERIHYIKTQ